MFRHTFGAFKLSNLPIFEINLSHEKQDKVSASYNSAKHLPYRTTMLQEYADYLDELKGGKLVRLPKQA